ncbi:MAG: hypothetical protein R3183_13270, partial [Oleiphilaceae bacterium]|nr:hypothetical protein [Oleiphilaceae bacterium]
MFQLPRTAILAWCVLLCSIVTSPLSHASADALDQGMGKLLSSRLSDIETAVALLSEVNDERVETVFKALLESQLYRHKKEKKLVLLMEKQGSKVLIQDLFSDAEPYQVKKRAVKRVPVNNQLRGQIKAYLSAANLNHSS